MEPIEIYCPWCHKHVALAWLALNLDPFNPSTVETTHPVFYTNEKGRWSVGVCPACKNCVLIRLKDNGKIDVFPHSLPPPTDERIPDKIRKDLDEAKACLTVNAFRACAGLCRRALQQACILKKADKNKKLKEQIDELADKRIITEDLRNLAHSVRWVGNDALHPENQDVTEEDAKEILNLTEQFMEVIFVAPEKVKEIKERHGRIENKN